MNIADKAELKTNNITSGEEYLTDGQINASVVYKELEAVSGGGLSTLTFTFENPWDIIGVMVYNSSSHDTSFTSVKNIKIGEYYSFDDVKVMTDSYEERSKQVYSGSAAILELNKAVKVYSVTITFESDSPIQISEIKILAKKP